MERAAWRLRSAERERDWALVSARTCGVSIRKLVVAAGLSSSRVHQLLRAVDLDALDAVLGQLREVGWLRRAAGWLVQLDAGGYPPAVNLRPDVDWPASAVVAVNLARVAAVLDRIASDVEEFARACRVDEVTTAAVLADRRRERRRRLAEPDLDFRAFCHAKRMPTSSRPQLERAWEA